MEEISLKDKIENLGRIKKEAEEKKKKKFKIPMRGRPSKRKLKKGYMVVMRIDDNGNCDFEKQQIEDSTYRLKGGDYHTSEKKDMLFYKGKMPLVIQPVKKLNPYNPLFGKNETYGQPYVMARMLKDSIKVKKNQGNLILWLVIGGAILFAINYFLGK